jgi:hypothetical protein
MKPHNTVVYGIRFASCICFVFAALCLTINSFAADEPKPAGPAFDEFSIVFEKNIFNPDRRSLSKGPISIAPPKPQIESSYLLGALISNDGAYAFFENSGSNGDSVLKVGDDFCGRSIVSINSSSIKLKDATQTIDLNVGMGMQRIKNGPWTLASESAKHISRSTSRHQPPDLTRDNNDEPKASATDSAASSSNDILKKLMERRKQEMQK